MSNARPSIWLIIGLLGAVARPGLSGELPPPPTIVIRAVHPDREAAAVIRWFEGSRAASPAAALSAWKRASQEPKRLGKVGDAIFALFNPRMVREYQTLDAAELAISFADGSSQPHWRTWFPHDDGTLGMIGPTADLSGGGIEPPIGDYRVDRFPGSTLILVARGPLGVFAASSREQLEAAVRAAAIPATVPPIESGWLVRIDPSSSTTWTSLLGRRCAEAARITGCQLISGRFRIVKATVLASWIGQFRGDAPVVAAIDPDWLDAIPARGPLAAFGLRVDPREETWTRFFDLIDRVERVDPERASMAPSRLRLALAARALGIRLETEVWPHLEGVSGWVGMADGQVNRAMVAVHLDAVDPARLLVAGVKGNRVQDGADEVIAAGAVAGRPLRLIRRQASVYIAWGDQAWAESRAALDTPDRSARLWLSRSRTGALPTRVGSIWPDQIPGVPPGTPLAASLATAPPIRWAGGNEGNRTLDEVWADGLDATVRRFLDLLPLDAPPEP